MPWLGILLLFIKDIREQIKIPHNSYLIMWILVTIIFYSLMATKYLTYIFPVLFPTALLLGHFITNVYYDCSITKNDLPGVAFSIPAILLFTLFGVVAYIKGIGSVILYFNILIAVLIILWLNIKGNSRRFTEIIALLTMIVSITLVGAVLPGYMNERSAKQVASFVDKGDTIAASYGNYSTSFVFYTDVLATHLAGTKEKKERNEVWNTKNPMPIENKNTFIEKAKKKSNAYILVDLKDKSKVSTDSVFAGYKLVNTSGNLMLYRKE